MADLKDTSAKLKDIRELMAKARDDLHALGLDLQKELHADVKAWIQGEVKKMSGGLHTVVMSCAELEEGLAAL